eukprot:scaffold2472_cov65-Phaeocystis_antarctica.AAC.3
MDLMVSETSDDDDELGSSEVEAGAGEDDATGVAILVVRSLGRIDGRFRREAATEVTRSLSRADSVALLARPSPRPPSSAAAPRPEPTKRRRSAPSRTHAARASSSPSAPPPMAAARPPRPAPPPRPPPAPTPRAQHADTPVWRPCCPAHPTPTPSCRWVCARESATDRPPPPPPRARRARPPRPGCSPAACAPPLAAPAPARGARRPRRAAAATARPPPGKTRHGSAERARAAVVLGHESALCRAALHKGVAAKERGSGVIGRSEGPRRVGEALRRELAQPRRRLPGDRVEQRRRGVAGRRERPRRVGEVLRIEVAQASLRRLLGDRVEQRRRGVASRRVRPRRVRELLWFEVAQPSLRCPLGDRVEQRWLAPPLFCKAVHGVGELLSFHLTHAPRSVRRQPCPQRVARPPAFGRMKAGQAVDGVRQRPCVEFGQRLLGMLGERLQHIWCFSQHSLLALLAHQLAQCVPRGAEVIGTVLFAVLCVRVDDLPHGAELAYPWHAR